MIALAAGAGTVLAVFVAAFLIDRWRWADMIALAVGIGLGLAVFVAAILIERRR